MLDLSRIITFRDLKHAESIANCSSEPALRVGPNRWGFMAQYPQPLGINHLS